MQKRSTEREGWLGLKELSPWLVLSTKNQSISAKKNGDRKGIARSLNDLAVLYRNEGNYAQAGVMYEQGLALCRELGDRRMLAAVLLNLGVVKRALKDADAARALYQESLSICRSIRDKDGTAFALANIAQHILDHENNLSKGQQLYEESFKLRRELGDKRNIALILTNLANAAAKAGEFRKAKEYFRESLEIRREPKDNLGIYYLLLGCATFAAYIQKNEDAAKLFGSAEVLRLHVRHVVSPPEWENYEKTITQVRSSLSETKFNQLFDQGRADPRIRDRVCSGTDQ